MRNNYLSIRQLRENFPAIRKRVENGEQFTLIHRSKPFARLVSLYDVDSLTPRPGVLHDSGAAMNSAKRVSKEAAIKKIKRLAAQGPALGINLSAEELDDLYDESYEL